MSAKSPLRCVVLGGGGHARVLIDCLLASKEAVPVAIVDADRSLWGTTILGVKIVGGDEKLTELLYQGVSGFAVGLGGTKDNGPRRTLFELAMTRGFQPVSVRHPSSICSPSAEIGAGSVLYPRSVVNACAKLGMNVIVNTGAIVEHDCVIGDHAHISTGAVLSGTVVVGEMVHVGAGSVIKQGLTIGEAAVVGAGSTVVSDVVPRTTVIGERAGVYVPEEVTG
ncbi:MAG: acetyltransferase [Candidatus Omnitrophota bacterium]|nr:acetyltransferase [Candidatus Omnitrophota bacterium]